MVSISLGKRVMATKYGIKVPFDGSYLWVTQQTPSNETEPVLFDSEKSAQAAAKIWGPLAQIKQYPVDNT